MEASWKSSKRDNINGSLDPAQWWPWISGWIKYKMIVECSHGNIC